MHFLSFVQVHVSTLDFALLTAAAPFWMSNDAQQRKWEGRYTKASGVKIHTVCQNLMARIGNLH
jgi:hypothetical protein